MTTQAAVEEAKHVLAMTAQYRDAVFTRFGEIDDRMEANRVLTDSVKDDVLALKDDIAELLALKEDIKELVETVRFGKGGLKVLGWLGSGAKWIGGIAAAFVAIYSFVQNLRGH